MTLGNMKQRVFVLVEEINPDSPFLTDDIDYQLKINTIIDQVQNEVSRRKKISSKASYTISETTRDLDIYDERYLERFYKLDRIVGCKYNMIANRYIEFDKDYIGSVIIYYYKYPKMIEPLYYPDIEEIDNDEEKERLIQEIKTNDESYVFELSQDVLEIMSIGIAHHILLNDMISSYGGAYGNEYNRLLQTITESTQETSFFIDGGF